MWEIYILKKWYESEMKVNDLIKIEVEGLVGNKTTRNMFKGETYYFINDEGSVAEDEEDFTEVDDERYKFGNYFESKEEAEMCRELIIKTIGAFKESEECIYLAVNDEGILLSFAEWDLLNQHVEKLRKFK